MKIRPAGWMQKLLESKPGKYLTNPASNAAVTIATISNITKDGVNCFYYVTQSLNNERIPEDKRKFVAGIDLANGILNVTLQGAVSALIATGVTKAFDKVIAPKYFSEEQYKKLWQSVKSEVDFHQFSEWMNKTKGSARLGLSLIATLVSMQVITKRVIVPFISTPMASYFKEYLEKREQKKLEAENKTKTEKPKEIDND